MNIKVEDHDAPSLAILAKTIEHIDNHVKNDKPVLIHCNGGRGITGVLITAYLMIKENPSRADELTKVKQLRKKIPGRGKQLDTLSEHEQYLRR